MLFESCRIKSKHICNPIVDWSDRDAWEYIRAEKIPLNPLYGQGYFRVGCVGYPMSGKQRYREFAMGFQYEEQLKKALKRQAEINTQLEVRDDDECMTEVPEKETTVSSKAAAQPITSAFR